MINAIKARILITKNLMTYYSQSNHTDDFRRGMDKGCYMALQGELQTLEELLITAEKLQELSA